MLQDQLRHLIIPSLFLNNEEYEDFLNLVKDGKLIRDVNPEYHCCVFFIPYNLQTQEILIVHHKKAKQWIVSGGHIEQGELLEDAVKREAKEELGINIKEVGKPFLFSVMYIHNEGQECKAHYDTWYLVPVTEEIVIDLTEFNEAEWVSIPKAKELITHSTYVKALEKMPVNDYVTIL